MWKIGCYYGFALIALGLYGYSTSEIKHITSLIPAFFGIPIVILSYLAQKESRRKHMMHAVVLLALLGVMGTFRGLTLLPATLANEATGKLPMMVYSQSFMAILSIGFIVLAVRSFIAARGARG